MKLAFLDIIKALIDFAVAFKLEYDVKFVDTRKKNIVVNTFLYKSLLSQNYCNIRALLFILEAVAHPLRDGHFNSKVKHRKANGEEIEYIVYPKWSVMYTPEPEELEMMADGADYFIKIRQRAPSSM